MSAYRLADLSCDGLLRAFIAERGQIRLAKSGGAYLLSVGKIAGENATAFGASSLAEVAGLLHDLGKYSETFSDASRGMRFVLITPPEVQ